MPKVSVLMPVYNTKEEYLREAIESVLNQTFPDFELIILNDASKDENVERVVRSYTDKRIVYAKNQQNMGISRTRNRLIDLAKGDYLAITDHDDVSLPDRFEKQVKFLDRHPDVGVVGAAMQELPSGRVVKMPETNREIEEHLCFVSAVAHPVSMIRKKVFLETGLRYEEDFSPAEDCALWCRLIGKTRFYNLPDVLLKYRWHETNQTHLQTKKMDEAGARILLFVRREHPDLWARVKNKADEFYTIRILGIPFFKLKRENKKVTLLLFGKIPLMSAKYKMKMG